MTNQDDAIGAMLRETAGRVFGQHCDQDVLRAADRGVWPAALWNAIAQAGLHQALLPERAGGFGVAVADALSLLRVAGEHAVPVPLAETMLASWLLALAGLPVPDGPLTVGPVRDREGVALTRSGSSWRVFGAVTRIPWARHAAGLVILAEHQDQTWLVLAGPSAWTIEPGENVAKEPRDTVRLDGPAVAAARIDATVPHLRLAGAAMRTQQIAGALTRLTTMTTDYARTRVQFGRPLAKFQAVQQNLAVLAGQTAAAVAAADLASAGLSATDPAAIDVRPIAAGKSRANEAAGIAAAIAHQVHGAIGFTFEHNLHFLTRRLWSWRDEFGKEAEWNRLLGNYLAQAGADRLWASITAA